MLLWKTISWRFRKEIALSLLHWFFQLNHLHRFSYIELESIHGISSKSFFILECNFSIYLFHKMLYHQTTTNQTKIIELKTIPFYELMRPSKSIINLANVHLAVYLEKLNLPEMQKVKCKSLHARQPCRTSTHPICTAVFSAIFGYVITAWMPATNLNIIIKLLVIMKI